MRIVDLSLPLEPSASEPSPVRIERVTHEEGADILGRPAGIPRSAFPDGMGVNLEHVWLTSHSGTHVDAPFHYGPRSGGEPAATIDALPLDLFFADGVLLDCRSDDPGPIRPEELGACLFRIEHTLAPGEIVLLWTGADALWGRPDYFTEFRGVSAEATEWLVSQEVRVIGIDSFGFDAPFHRMLASYLRTRDSGALWPAHIYGRRRPYCQIERLANLAALPSSKGFKVATFPVKLRGCGAAWCRTVALIP